MSEPVRFADELPPLPAPEAWRTRVGPWGDHSTDYAYTVNQMRAYATQAVAERLAALETENAALKREAHTWSKAAEHYAKPLHPLDPLDVEELWDVANADPYADEVHQEFARLLQRKLGIEG